MSLVAAAAGLLPAASRATPNVSPGVFKEISTGVARITTYGCAGRPIAHGTGVLVGDSIVMTARHVLEGACKVHVLINGDRFVGVRSASWHGGGASFAAADVATIKLDKDAVGAHVFSIRSSLPPAGSNLGMVGYPLGNRLSLNQGKIIFRVRKNGAPLLAVRMLGAEGASGAPFIDDAGRVVGIMQIGLGSKDVIGQRTSGVLVGLDLVRWWGPKARLDLCRAYPNGGIAGCPNAKVSVDVVITSGSGTVESRPAGISCPGVCSATFPNGTKVVFTARPTAGNIFTTWLEPCSSNATCALRVREPLTLFAAFETPNTAPPPLPQPPAPTAPPSGHYAGRTSQNEVINFEVSGFTLRNLTTGQVNQSCNPPLNLYGGNLSVSQSNINTDGSFKIEWSATGTVGPVPANHHTVIEGHFSGATVAGTLKVDTSFTWTDGVGCSCTSGLVSWTASLAS
jgi:hypothetical protein